jgi:hypothetical protein
MYWSVLFEELSFAGESKIKPCFELGISIKSLDLNIQEAISLHITPWSRVLKKQIVAQLVKKFPDFYALLWFITTFTRAVS